MRLWIHFVRSSLHRCYKVSSYHRSNRNSLAGRSSSSSWCTWPSRGSIKGSHSLRIFWNRTRGHRQETGGTQIWKAAFDSSFYYMLWFLTMPLERPCPRAPFTIYVLILLDPSIIHSCLLINYKLNDFVNFGIIYRHMAANIKSSPLLNFININIPKTYMHHHQLSMRGGEWRRLFRRVGRGW